MGYPFSNIPQRSTNLICFRAGGYPKKRCSQWCSEQDPTATYTRLANNVPYGQNFYGPWGRNGAYNPWPAGTPEAKCSYQKTSTTTVTALDLALTADSSAIADGGSKWDGPGTTSFNETTETYGRVPFTHIPATVDVKISVRSKAGPRMQGIKITDGCGPCQMVRLRRPSVLDGAVKFPRGAGFCRRPSSSLRADRDCTHRKGGTVMGGGAFGNGRRPVRMDQLRSCGVQPQPGQAYVPRRTCPWLISRRVPALSSRRTCPRPASTGVRPAAQPQQVRAGSASAGIRVTAQLSGVRAHGQAVEFLLARGALCLTSCDS